MRLVDSSSTTRDLLVLVTDIYQYQYRNLADGSLPQAREILHCESYGIKTANNLRVVLRLDHYIDISNIKVQRDMLSGKFAGSMKDNICNKTTLVSIKFIYI